MRARSGKLAIMSRPAASRTLTSAAGDWLCGTGQIARLDSPKTGCPAPLVGARACGRLRSSAAARLRHGVGDRLVAIAIARREAAGR
jgi:hypothetical protein